MNNIRYLLSAIAAALMAAGEVFKDYADNTPDIDSDGVVTDETVTAEQIASGTAELDSSGLPHHPTIHASTKTKKADGTWTKRKSVDDVTFNAITAELRKTYPAPEAAAAPSPAPAPAPTAGPSLKPPGSRPALKPPVAAPKSNYTKLCEYIAGGIAGKHFDQAWIDFSLKESGLKSIADLQSDEESSLLWLNGLQEAVPAYQYAG